MNELLNLDVYVVRNKEGKFFRRKGYGGGGNTWVDDIATARIYVKIGPARACVSFFANKYPEYGYPDIIRLTTTQVEVMNEQERVEKQQQAKIKRKQEQELRLSKWRLQKSQADVKEAQAALKREQAKLRGK